MERNRGYVRGKQIMPLSQMQVGQRAIICRVGNLKSSEDWMKKLLEMGFLEGSSIELLYESARKKQSALMAVRVRGGLVALRRSEAQSIEVELL